MTNSHCAVHACTGTADDQLIVALRHSVGLADVCAPHGEAIRSGVLHARPHGSGILTVELELLPAA